MSTTSFFIRLNCILYSHCYYIPNKHTQKRNIFISFVYLTLTSHDSLEENCASHAQLMTDKSNQDEEWCSGHVLLVTATPREYVKEHGTEEIYPHQLPDMPKPDLAKMLNLSQSLPGLTEELTPIMAWASILHHPRFRELTGDDIAWMGQELKPRMNCYGYV
jgi:hypothetical protein